MILAVPQAHAAPCLATGRGYVSGLVFGGRPAWRGVGGLGRVDSGGRHRGIPRFSPWSGGCEPVDRHQLFVYWVVVRPMAEASATQFQWPYVLWFSATILTLAFAVPAFGRMIGGRWVVRLRS